MASSGKLEEIKGRIEEAIGVLTGNTKQKRRGKIDQVAGKAKRGADKMVDKARHAAKQMSKSAH